MSRPMAQMMWVTALVMVLSGCDQQVEEEPSPGGAKDVVLRGESQPSKMPRAPFVAQLDVVAQKEGVVPGAPLPVVLPQGQAPDGYTLGPQLWISSEEVLLTEATPETTDVLASPVAGVPTSVVTLGDPSPTPGTIATKVEALLEGYRAAKKLSQDPLTKDRTLAIFGDAGLPASVVSAVIDGAYAAGYGKVALAVREGEQIHALRLTVFVADDMPSFSGDGIIPAGPPLQAVPLVSWIEDLWSLSPSNAFVGFAVTAFPGQVTPSGGLVVGARYIPPSDQGGDDAKPWSAKLVPSPWMLESPEGACPASFWTGAPPEPAIVGSTVESLCAARGTAAPLVVSLPASADELTYGRVVQVLLALPHEASCVSTRYLVTSSHADSWLCRWQEAVLYAKYLYGQSKKYRTASSGKPLQESCSWNASAEEVVASLAEALGGSSGTAAMDEVVEPTPHGTLPGDEGASDGASPSDAPSAGGDTASIGAPPSDNPYHACIEVAGPPHWTVSKPCVTSKIADWVTLGKQARLVPHYTNGAYAGFKLIGVKPASIYLALGLQSYDVVKSIAGTPLDGIGKMTELISSLADESEVVVELERQGESLSHTYTLTDTNAPAAPPSPLAPQAPVAKGASGQVLKHSPVEYTVPIAIAAQVDEANQWGAMGKIVPVFSGTTSKGVKLVGVGPKSLFRAIGLRSGDIIVDVGGAGAMPVGGRLPLYDALLTPGDLQVTIERKGEPLILTYHLVSAP